MSDHTSRDALFYHRLQDGIYFRKDDRRPKSAYRLLLLNVKPNTGPGDARDAIATVWRMLQELRDGVVRDLRPTRPGDREIEEAERHTGELTCLLGFGARLFDSDRSLTPNGERPPVELVHLNGAASRPFPSLPWSRQDRRTGEADLALQFIAATELAVNRAVVEVCTLIDETGLPLDFVTFHGGFNRADRRSWLNFHDGISNLEYDERAIAIEVMLKEPPWMAGGTYMAFLRVGIDLRAWRSLSREEQEIAVGRDKLTGCPLESVGDGRVPVPLAGCPFGNRGPKSREYRNPGEAHDTLVAVSHMHAANVNRKGPEKDENNRIFRQGYEFLEPLADGQLCVGLNFVSFQRNLSHLTNILRTPGWLGTVNFGGRSRPEEPRPIELASIIAGGYYAVPPTGDVFPGAAIFG